MTAATASVVKLQAFQEKLFALKDTFFLPIAYASPQLAVHAWEFELKR